MIGKRVQTICSAFKKTNADDIVQDKVIIERMAAGSTSRMANQNTKTKAMLFVRGWLVKIKNLKNHLNV